MNTVFVKTYPEIKVNKNEIIRYAKGADEGVIDELLSECLPKLTYKVCYMRFPAGREGDILDLGFMKTDSKSLLKNLDGCDELVLFGATIGIEFDRLMQRYTRLSPAKAYILQGIGAERIESLCDAFCDEIENGLKKDGKYIHPRFSAGYGDFPLDAQKGIFSVLDASRKIGLTLTDSLIMSPSKSVTAIVGISDTPHCEGHKCASCDKKDCEYREG